MANVDAQNATIAGTQLVYAPVNASDALECGNDVGLLVKNGGGVPCTVTLVTPGTVSGLAVADSAVSIPAGQERLIGSLDPQVFLDPATNRCTVTYSATATVTAALIRS